MLWPLAVVWGGDVECEVRAGDRPQQHGVTNTPELQTSTSWGKTTSTPFILPSQSLLPNSCMGPLYSFLLTFFFAWSLNTKEYLIPQETWTNVLDLTEQWTCRWDSPWSQTIGSDKYYININIIKVIILSPAISMDGCTGKLSTIRKVFEVFHSWGSLYFY